ncbi:MAG: N-acetylmuramoyl-L-alanine amidase [Firmicutes bacterium]|nr:N-acetylmuramoyl-L-alanine amidase [Bacillota bacterium]
MPSVFLSPSTQEYNPYVNGGNEEQYMNLIADAMEPYLQATGIEYRRNDPSLTVGGSVRLSNQYRPDLHLAIHSNAAPDYLSGAIQGTDVYYYPGSQAGRAFAEQIVRSMEEIYPYPELVGASPNGGLYELRESQAPAVLVEVAYHDNPEDAGWIKNNVETIARALARATADALGVPFVDPVAARPARVATPGFAVNLRSRPAWDAPAVAVLPNRTRIQLLSEENGWFQVRVNGMTGYINAQYITEQTY